MTATQLTSTVRGALSPRLAALALDDVQAGALARLVAEEALWAIGGRDAVVWVYRHGLKRLLLEQEGLDVDSVDVESADGVAIVERPEIWQGRFTGTRRRILEASFAGAAMEHHAAPVLSLPLRAGDRLVGLLLVESPPVTVDGGADAAVQPFAGQAAALLHNHAQHASARRNEANLQALYETAGELSSNLELETVLRAIANRARVLLQAPISHVMLADANAAEIAMRVSDGTTRPGFDTLRLKLGLGLGGRVAERLTPFYTSDYLNDTRFGHDAAVDMEVRAEGIRSIIGVPMAAGGAFIGVLFVADRVVRTFTDADVDVLSSLAHHAAIALRGAELYDRATTAVANLERINRVVQLQNRSLERAAALHRRLSQAMLAGQGLREIVGLFADFMQADVVVLDHRHRVLAQAGQPVDDLAARLSADGLEHVMAGRPDVREAMRTVEDREPAVLGALAGADSEVRLILPVAARDEVLGSIWVAVRPDALADDRPLVEQAARVIALDLLKDRAIAEVERRAGRELLDALLAENPNLEGGLERRASDLGVDLAIPHRVLAVGLDRRAPDRGPKVACATREELVAALRRQPWCPFVAEYGTVVVGLVPATEQYPAESLRPIVEGFGNRVTRARAVISAPCATVDEYRPQFIASRRLLELLGDHDGSSVVDLDEAWVLALLFRGGGEAELRRFIEARLGPLLDHDEEHGLGLVPTLEAYLEADRSPTRTAGVLHVHVNTVYYRVERLKAILGEGFAEPRRALDLQVALLADRLLRGRASRR
jgi:sugar diacid utilization regulator